jgi:hypothetical protein
MQGQRTGNGLPPSNTMSNGLKWNDFPEFKPGIPKIQINAELWMKNQ